MLTFLHFLIGASFFVSGLVMILWTIFGAGGSESLEGGGIMLILGGIYFGLPFFQTSLGEFTG